MASRGDIKFEELQPNLCEKWLKLGFEETLGKTGSFTKLKSKEYFDEGEFPVIDQGDSFISGYINDEELLYQGELPVVIFGDHTRVVKFIDFKFATGADGTKVLKPIELFDSMFYFYYLKSLKIPSLGYSRHFKILKEVKIPLPPLPEQQRIVAKLDEMFGHLETLKAKLENIPQLIKNFRQAVLTQAVTGKLTEEWRKGKELDNEYSSIESDEFREVKNILPQEWVALAFSSVATIKSNLVNPNNYSELQYITPDCIEKENGQLIKVQLVKDIKPVSDKHFFEAHSIIYSKIRPYLSKLIIADYEGLCSADMYPIKTELKLEYLFYYMLSSQFLSYANTAGTRSVLPKINQKGLSKIPVLVPPKIEQVEIVKRVEHLFAKADAIEAQYQSLKTKIDNLPQAILTKAFKGELVQQLPTDGDAKELLAQIQQLKSEMKTKSKKRTVKK